MKLISAGVIAAVAVLRILISNAAAHSRTHFERIFRNSLISASHFGPPVMGLWYLNCRIRAS